MDYIIGLSKVGDLGIIVADPLSKYVTFIATPIMYPRKRMLFYKHIIMRSLIYYIFWTRFFKLLRPTLGMSSIFHPQSDG